MTTTPTALPGATIADLTNILEAMPDWQQYNRPGCWEHQSGIRLETQFVKGEGTVKFLSPRGIVTNQFRGKEQWVFAQATKLLLSL